MTFRMYGFLLPPSINVGKGWCVITVFNSSTFNFIIPKQSHSSLISTLNDELSQFIKIMEQPNDNCTTNEQKEIEFIAVQREYHKIEPTINDRKENNSEADDASSELSTDICIYDTAYDLKQDPDNPLLFHICLKSSSHSLTSMSPCFNGPKIKSCFVPLRDFRIRHRRRSLNFLVPKPPPATSKEKKSVPVQKKNAKKKQPPAPMKQIQKAVLTKPPVPSHPIKDPLQDNDAFMTHEISERSENGWYTSHCCFNFIVLSTKYFPFSF